MGHIYVDVRVYRLDLSAYREVRLLVDTGSTFTWVSGRLLSELGITPMREREFRTIEGKVVKRPIGMGVVECMGERAPAILVFAGEGDAEVLGTHTLEGLGLEVDPMTKSLRRTEAILAV